MSAPQTSAFGLQTSKLSAQASASVWPFLGDWAAASNALAELSKDLEEDLRKINVSSTASAMSQMRKKKDPEKLKRRRKLVALAGVAGHFPNSRKPNGLEAWNGSEDTANLIKIAVQCSKALYDEERIAPTISRHSSSLSQTITAQPRQLVKETAFFQIERVSVDGLATTLVVSIRGSRGTADWVVNLNNGVEHTKGFIDMETVGGIMGDTNPAPILAHGGFLAAARSLVDHITEPLYSFMTKTTGPLNILFTGHSAGGAVASLLYAHFYTNNLSTFIEHPKTSLSLITFGSPPVFSRPLTTTLIYPSSLELPPPLTLSIISEGDPVPRLDAPYSRILAGLFQSANEKSFGGTPLPENTPLKPNNPQLPQFIRNLLNNDKRNEIINRTENEFPLTKLGLWSLGETIMLSNANAAVDGEMQLVVEKVPDSVGQRGLEKMLCANVIAHKLDKTYVPWVDLLAAGRFNGKEGWENRSTALGGLGWGAE